MSRRTVHFYDDNHTEAVKIDLRLLAIDARGEGVLIHLPIQLDTLWAAHCHSSHRGNLHLPFFRYLVFLSCWYEDDAKS